MSPVRSPLLAEFERDIERAGLVGEKTNAVLVFLVSISALLANPLNLSIEGCSSAGKNFLMKSVAKFLPDDRQKFLTGMSPKALMYAEADEYQHRAVFIAEYEGVAGADFAIRTFQSEQTIEWAVVDTSGGRPKKVQTKVQGPAAFIQATTRPVLHPENETRLLFTRIDESEPQTKAILARQARDAVRGRTMELPKDFYDAWHARISGLIETRVIVPYATQLCQRFPSNKVSSRRDFPKLIGLIEASTFLHQHEREKTQDGCIIADGLDYRIARELFVHCYDAGPERAVQQFLEAAKAQPGAMNGVGFSVTAVMSQLRWGKSKAYRVKDRAEDLGCIAETETHGKWQFLHDIGSSIIGLPESIR